MGLWSVVCYFPVFPFCARHGAAGEFSGFGNLLLDTGRHTISGVGVAESEVFRARLVDHAI